MKNILIFGMILFGFSAFGQEKVEETELKKTSEEITFRCGTPTGVYSIEGIKLRPLNTDGYFMLNTKIIQPTETNEQPNGTMPLSKDLPFVHTIRGVVYTADHLKYTPRR